MCISDSYYPKVFEFIFDIDIDNMCDPPKQSWKKPTRGLLKKLGLMNTGSNI